VHCIIHVCKYICMNICVHMFVYTHIGGSQVSSLLNLQHKIRELLTFERFVLHKKAKKHESKISKEPLFSLKLPCIFSKQPCILSKNSPTSPQKSPVFSQMRPARFSKEPCILSKEPYIRQKRGFQKSFSKELCIHKWRADF